MASNVSYGAPPRVYEVFGNLSNTVATNLMDLAKLNQTMTDYQVKETDENLRVANIEARQKQIAQQSNQPQSVNVQNNTYNFTSNEMLNMLKQLNLTKEVTPVEELPKFDLH